MRYHGFQRLPLSITAALEALPQDQFEVAAARTIKIGDSISDIAHLVQHSAAGSIEPVSHAVLPSAEVGRWSKWNLDGRVIKLTDQPKVTKTYSWTSPNFGDPARGHHTTIQEREVWQRRELHGQRISLLVSTIAGSGSNEARVVVRVDRPFNRRDYAPEQLLLAVSLIQENFGAAGVRPTDRSISEWIGRQFVTWEFLPPGEDGRPPSFEAVRRHFSMPDDAERTRIARARYEQIHSLRPSGHIVGRGEFSRYVGFQFSDDVIVLENLDYGNAIYIMYENWQRLSQRSRLDLLGDSDANYDRIVHRRGWEERLRQKLQLKGLDVD